MVDGRSSGDDIGLTNNKVAGKQSLAEDGELTESLINESCQWPQLRCLVFKYNNLERIDGSLVRIICITV